MNAAITLCQLQEGISAVVALISQGMPQMVVLANVHTLNCAYESEGYRNVLKNAAIVLRDGCGVAWAAKMHGATPGHNFVGTDFIPEFCRLTEDHRYRFYLLGARPGIAEKAAGKLKAIAPGITIAGCQHGYFENSRSAEVVDRINASDTDVLLVAMGNPKQEFWIADNLYRLTVPVSVGVGALFDYLSGRVPRAPNWVLKSNLEWVYRLLVEPRRLWKRYLFGNPKFVYRICQHVGTKK